MFILYAEKNKLTVQQREAVTSGSVNTCTAQFGFSEDWDGLDRVAVFRAGNTAVSVLLDQDGRCIVPWEVLADHDRLLTVGVCGIREGIVILPTVWAGMGIIREGVKPEGCAPPPTPGLWEQAVALKGDGLGYTDEGKLGLYAGDRLLSSVPVTNDHRLLDHRDEGDQHPIASITGLRDELERIPQPVEPLTNTELEEILT